MVNALENTCYKWLWSSKGEPEGLPCFRRKIKIKPLKETNVGMAEA